jgi:hypothetical protein
MNEVLEQQEALLSHQYESEHEYYAVWANKKGISTQEWVEWHEVMAEIERETEEAASLRKVMAKAALHYLERAHAHLQAGDIEWANIYQRRAKQYATLLPDWRLSERSNGKALIERLF